VQLFPKHIHFVEPFFGGGSVMLAKDPEGISEVANDLNHGLTNFWRTLQCPIAFPQFCRLVEAIPLSRVEWQDAHDALNSAEELNKLELAVAFFVNCRQSLAGRGKSFTAMTRTRTRRGMNGNVSEWLGAVEGLPLVHARLKRVVIENRDALEVIRKEDTKDTLTYCDPPYLHSTRSAKEVYEHEMTKAQHIELLETILACKGKVMISGYPSPLYDAYIGDWTRHVFEISNHASGAKTKGKEQEILWVNW
jgi:DNA adenine methylase